MPNQFSKVPNGHKTNLETIVRAAKADDLAVLSTREKATGKPAFLLVALAPDGAGDFNITPLARMFDGNPFDDFDPPIAEDNPKPPLSRSPSHD